MEISRDDVTQAYRLLLEREPESEEAITAKLQCRSINNLVTEIALSGEFQDKHPLLSSRVNAWVLTEAPSGFRIWINLADTAVSWHVVKNDFEPVERSFVEKHLSAGNTALDIGANIGFFSMLMAKVVGPTGKVIGFEPLPFLYEAVLKSARENNFTWYSIHNVALAADNGKAILVYAPDSPNWGGAFLSFDGSILPDHASLEVPITPLTKFTQGLKVDFIKIDIEGAEYTALSPCAEYLADTKPVIMSEVHRGQLQKVSNVTPRQYIQFFESIGYTCHPIIQNGEIGDRITGNENFTLINIACMP